MKMFSMVMAAALAVCGVANAQFAADAIKVHFDRPVIAAGTELAPGDYTIRMMPSGSGNLILEVRSESGTQALLVNPVRVKGASYVKGESVILSRHGDQYWLDQVWLTPDMGFEVLQQAGQ